ncbi:MAG TPA: SDR family oxidoreductase [Chthoniobacterales bacterium]|jgi:short-subunit dehydrogenase
MRTWQIAALGGAALLLGSGVLRRRKTPLDGKVVAITGGSRGLGLELARVFGSRGARLALIARNEAELQRAAAELGEHGIEVSIWPADLTEGDACETLPEKIATHHGAIDILVNNAGEIVVGPFETFTHDDFHRSLAIHLWAPLRLTQAVLSVMKRQGGGRIANISSIGGKVPVPHLSSYCAGKFALVGLSGALRAELKRDGIVVTTVCPGLMRTGSHWNAMFKGNREAEFAWFGHGASLPGASISAVRAARQIVSAIQRGDADLTITWQAQAAVVAAALTPALVAAAEAVVARLLPEKPDEGGSELASGWESRSRWMPTFLTRLGDRAAVRNNELRGHSPPAR